MSKRNVILEDFFSIWNFSFNNKVKESKKSGRGDLPFLFF